MRKVKLFTLTPRDYFKFSKCSSEYKIVIHTIDSGGSPVTKIINKATYRITTVSSYLSVFLPPYEFAEQLTLF